MKYNVGDKVFHTSMWHAGCTGHLVVEAKENMGMWQMPHYKVESKEAKTGFAWIREWMLK